MVFLFTAVTSPVVVLFGPFNNVKRAVIGAILQSRHPHYITWLFSTDELQAILGSVGVVKSQDLFKFNAREDKDLKLEKIESSRYVGYVLEIPDPRRIQVATAANIQEKGDTTSNIAKMNVNGTQVRKVFNDNFGHNFWTNKSKTATIFIPATGVRGLGTGSFGFVGARSYYWTASSGGQAFYTLYSDWELVHPLFDNRSANAGPIRPVSE